VAEMATLRFWREVYPETGRAGAAIPAGSAATSVEPAPAQLEQLRVQPTVDVA
jgi:hypothetical protein